MNYQIYKLNFLTAVHFGKKSLEDAEFNVAADTIFSALCHEYIKFYGTHGLKDFVENFRSGRMLISDAFPYINEELYIPRPMKAVGSILEQGDSQLKKAFKKLNYFPISQLECYLDGQLDPIEEIEYFKEFGTKEEREHASIRGEEETRPYRTGVFHFSEGSGLYIIFAYEDATDMTLIKRLFVSMGYSGIGGKRNAGLGRFEINDTEIPNELEERLKLEGKTHFMTLSVCLPRELELENCLKDAEYKLIKRSGFVQSSTYSPEQRRKNDLYVFQAGSCFHRQFLGDIYDVSSEGTHPVYRYAKPLFLGVRNEECH